MYLLKTHTAPILNDTPEGTEFVKATQGVLEDSTRGLLFNAEEHRYFLHGREVPSVSAVKSEFETPFNDLAQAESSSKNPRSQWFGRPVDDIVNEWKENNRKATTLGTRTHEFAEACCLFRLGHPELIEGEFRSRLTHEGLMAITPQEEAAARFWDSLDLQRYLVIAKETKIVNPVLWYAGTFDLLLFDTHEGRFVLIDYKTNKDLFKKASPSNRWMRGCFHRSVEDNSMGHYTIQQTIYSIELRNIGIDVGRMELIWLKSDGTYQPVQVNDCAPLVNFALTQRKLAILS